MLLKMALFHSFLWLSSVPLYVYIHLLYPFLCQWTFRLFQVLTIVNSAAVSIGVHVSFRIRVFPGYMPRSGIAGSYGNSVFSFLRSLFSVLYSGYANLHSHPQTHVLLKSFVLRSTHYFSFSIGDNVDIIYPATITYMCKEKMGSSVL